MLSNDPGKSAGVEMLKSLEEVQPDRMESETYGTLDL